MFEIIGKMALYAIGLAVSVAAIRYGLDFVFEFRKMGKECVPSFVLSLISDIIWFAFLGMLCLSLFSLWSWLLGLGS